MQIYEYVACYFVGFALSLLTLYVSGAKKKTTLYVFFVNSSFGFVASLAFVAVSAADSLLIAVGGFAGIAGQAVLCVFRVIGACVA